MKKQLPFVITVTACIIAGFFIACKKDKTDPPPTDIGTRVTFTEEFEKMYQLNTKGWLLIDKSYSSGSGTSAAWSQGMMGYDKGGAWHGFAAYAYTNTIDEYAYSLVYTTANNYTVSSWLISPVLSVKNGDKISFYTRGDTSGNNTNRMQVRLELSSSGDIGNTASSVGGFTNVIIEINPSENTGGYPTTWTKYEYTFTGISTRSDARIGFRHFVSNTSSAKGIGIDQFKFQVN